MLLSRRGRKAESIMKRQAFLFALLVAGAGTPVFAGYTLTTLASINGGSNGYGVGLTLSDSTLYGTTNSGGANGYGQVFSVPITGGTPTMLASFSGTNGGGPSGSLTLSGGTLYGTTQYGIGPNENEYGEVFSVPVTGGTPTVLASFNGGPNGSSPAAGVTLSGGTLYGTTANGGANDNGEVFSVPVTGGTPTVLASFNYATNGQNPQADLTISGSTVYGTTEGNGLNSYGTVFSVPVTGGTPSVLTSFNGTNGAYSQGGLLLSGSTLYGTTQSGGDIDYGEVFSVPVNGGGATVLASFNDSDGAAPEGNLILAGNTLYGTTRRGGTNDEGEVFSVPVTGGTPTVLLSFNGTNGSYPQAGLTLSGSTLYGTTTGGGANGDGTVFELSPSAPPFSPPQTNSGTISSGANQSVTVGNASTPGTVQATFGTTSGGSLSVTSGVDTVADLENSNNSYGGVPVTFALPADGSVVQIWDLNYSGTFAGPVQLVLDFDPTGMTASQENALAIYHFTGGQWVDIGGVLDLNADTITVDTNSLSPFVLGVQSVPEPASLSLLSLGSGAMLMCRRRRITSKVQFIDNRPTGVPPIDGHRRRCLENALPISLA